MLTYYILSGGHHPFGRGCKCESNIFDGLYSLEHVQDSITEHLVKWMINKNPKERPTVQQCLAHPFFWSTSRYYVPLIYNMNWPLMHFMKFAVIGYQFFVCFHLLMVILIHQQNRILKKYRQWRGGEKLQSDGQTPPGWTGSGCRGGKLEGLETQGVALVICFFVFVYLYWERGRETETEIWCFFSFPRSWCRWWTAKGSILRTLQD